jgi:hypothetical protein
VETLQVRAAQAVQVDKKDLLVAIVAGPVVAVALVVMVMEEIPLGMVVHCLAH